jgi:hypothetical protein
MVSPHSLLSIKIPDRRTVALEKLDVRFSRIHGSERMEQAQHWVHEIVLDVQLLIERQRTPIPLCVTAEELPSRDNQFHCASSFFLSREGLHC